MSSLQYKLLRGLLLDEMIVDTDILKRAEYFVTDLLTKKSNPIYSYHDLEHTQNVVEATKLLSEKNNLNRDQTEVALLAAWFHDTGYSQDYTDHEKVSIQILQGFLKDIDYPETKVERIAECIEATRMPQNPKTLEAKVVCDADLFNLASNEYFDRCEQLRKEITFTKGEDFSKLDWLKENVNFFQSHDYFTDYGKEVLQKDKEQNLELTKKKIAELELQEEREKSKSLEKKLNKLQKKVDKNSELNPVRGRETLFRTTSKNHLELSSMADNKANIMISINSIILSIVVTVLIRKLEVNPHLFIPTLILTLVCLMTIVFSILATRPNVSKGKFTKYDIINKKTNLLFFGNFHSVPLEDYEWGMKQMIKDGEYLYSSLIRDIYYLGVVLGKKYRYLRISYTIFMIGFVVSVLSFIISIVLYGSVGLNS